MHTTCINRLRHSLESRGNDHASWQPQRQKSETCFFVTDYESYGLMATFAHPSTSVKVASTNLRCEEGDFRLHAQSENISAEERNSPVEFDLSLGKPSLSWFGPGSGASAFPFSKLSVKEHRKHTSGKSSCQIFFS